jgi:hypothetical protein
VLYRLQIHTEAICDGRFGHRASISLAITSSEVRWWNPSFPLQKSLFTFRCPSNQAQQMERILLTIPPNSSNWTRKVDFPGVMDWPLKGEWMYVLFN